MIPKAMYGLDRDVDVDRLTNEQAHELANRLGYKLPKFTKNFPGWFARRVLLKQQWCLRYEEVKDRYCPMTPYKKCL